jgi:hypothetical protein
MEMESKTMCPQGGVEEKMGVVGPRLAPVPEVQSISMEQVTELMEQGEEVSFVIVEDADQPLTWSHQATHITLSLDSQQAPQQGHDLVQGQGHDMQNQRQGVDCQHGDDPNLEIHQGQGDDSPDRQLGQGHSPDNHQGQGHSHGNQHGQGHDPLQPSALLSDGASPSQPISSEEGAQTNKSTVSIIVHPSTPPYSTVTANNISNNSLTVASSSSPVLVLSSSQQSAMSSSICDIVVKPDNLAQHIIAEKKSSVIIKTEAHTDDSDMSAANSKSGDRDTASDCGSVDKDSSAGNGNGDGGKMMHQCTKCDYASDNKHYLKQHVAFVHNAARIFKCPFCDYAGKRSHALKEHLVVHSSERPYNCQHCNATFRKKGHLTNHTKLHSSSTTANKPSGSFCSIYL